MAVSSGWQATPVGIVRLSGPDSFELLGHLGAAGPAALARRGPHWTADRICLAADGRLLATVFWFRAPHSYTGQDVAEIHTVGCLPLLRELSASLIELGARRALPGEFTARAFLTGKLDARQVEGVLALMRAEHEAGVRQAARLARESERRLVADLVERITSLLALIEAGIDFVEEEDVWFTTPDEVVATLDALLGDLAELGSSTAGEQRSGKPHVALVGLRNAGKSTLFNVLVGHERALVSPVLGTTRDVLSAEVELDGMPVIFQDCAGLGDSTDELELATHLATERAAQQADLVLWIHSTDTPWSAHETASCQRIPDERRVLVRSKADLGGPAVVGVVPVPFADTTAVSAPQGTGIGGLRELLPARLGKLAAPAVDSSRRAELRAVGAALHRARSVAAESTVELRSPEIVSLELRIARDLLTERVRGPLDEELLGRIFGQFCVGK